MDEETGHSAFVSDIQPPITRTTDPQREIQEGRETNYAVTLTGAANPANPFGISFNGGKKKTMNIKQQVRLSPITWGQDDCFGRVWWNYDIGDDSRGVERRDWLPHELPLANFKFPGVDNPPENFRLEVASFWSEHRTELEERKGKSWSQLLAGTRKKPQVTYRNFCHVLLLQIPSRQTKDTRYTGSQTIRLEKFEGSKRKECTPPGLVISSVAPQKCPAVQGGVTVTGDVSGTDFIVLVCQTTLTYLFNKDKQWPDLDQPRPFPRAVLLQ
jgi:hypothetical protein